VPTFGRFEQLRLPRPREFSNLVDQQCAPRGGYQSAGMFRRAEQFVFGRLIAAPLRCKHYQWSITPAASSMDRLGNQLLASSTFSPNQHRAVCLGSTFDPPGYFTHGLRLADE
jgi:hypothetical protein